MQYQSFLFEKNWPKANVLFPLPRLWVRKLKDYFNKRKRNCLSLIVLHGGWHREKRTCSMPSMDRSFKVVTTLGSYPDRTYCFHCTEVRTKLANITHECRTGTFSPFKTTLSSLPEIPCEEKTLGSDIGHAVKLIAVWF